MQACDCDFHEGAFNAPERVVATNFLDKLTQTRPTTYLRYFFSSLRTATKHCEIAKLIPNAMVSLVIEHPCVCALSQKKPLKQLYGVDTRKNTVTDLGAVKSILFTKYTSLGTSKSTQHAHSSSKYKWINGGAIRSTHPNLLLDSCLDVFFSSCQNAATNRLK